jgi:hypothetical protein
MSGSPGATWPVRSQKTRGGPGRFESESELQSLWVTDWCGKGDVAMMSLGRLSGAMDAFLSTTGRTRTRATRKQKQPQG